MTEQNLGAGRALAALSAGRAEAGVPDLTIRSDDPLANLSTPLHNAPVETPQGAAMPQVPIENAGTTPFDGAVNTFAQNAALPPVDYAARQALGIEGAGQPPVQASGEITPPATPGSQSTSPVQRILVDFSDPSVVFQTKDGRQLSGKEVEGEMLLKREYSRKEWELLQQKRVVDAQSHLLTTAGKSKFGSTYIQAINAGASDDDAIAAGLAATGKFSTAQVPIPVAPEMPKEDDPDFFVKFAQYQRWQLEDVMDKKLAGIPQQQQPVQTGLTPEQIETSEHNKGILGAYIMPFMPENMTVAQNEYVSGLIRQVAIAEEISVNVADDRLSNSDVKIIRDRLFPNGQVPVTLQAELARLGQPVQAQQGYNPIPPNNMASPYPQGFPQHAAVGQNTVTLQAFMEMQKKNREYEERLGLAPPGVPHQPVAQAGGQSTALPSASGGAWDAVPVANRVQDQLAAIPRQ